MIVLLTTVILRWDDLSALKGQYMFQKAETEYLLKVHQNKLNEEIAYKTIAYFFYQSLDPMKNNKNQLLYRKWCGIIEKETCL